MANDKQSQAEKTKGRKEGRSRRMVEEERREPGKVQKVGGRALLLKERDLIPCGASGTCEPFGLGEGKWNGGHSLAGRAPLNPRNSRDAKNLHTLWTANHTLTSDHSSQGRHSCWRRATRYR